MIAHGSLSPGRDLDHYIHAISAFEILTPKAERALARQYRDEGNLDAARLLVLSHLRFVVHLTRSYSGYGLAQTDLIQEGNIGLMKAVKRFDPEYGVRLVSFAVHWIKAEIHEFILRNWRIVKVATTKAQRKLFFKLRSAKKRLGWMSGDEVRAIALDLGVAPEEVARMESRLASADASFDVNPSDHADATDAPAQHLVDPQSDPAELVATEDDNDEVRDRLHRSLALLDERSRDIIASRWLADDKLTLQDLGARYQVSAERIRQIETKAMKKLRDSMATFRPGHGELSRTCAN
ncbi:MAG: RNA polymerase sigma factor RpoH [Gammaproteobacteria bacterium]|nr:MAG: RNA polymerase sigma factor RpoH [Gammaproteobacteria bacterium]